jgi:hypothetical protein
MSDSNMVHIYSWENFVFATTDFAHFCFYQPKFGHFAFASFAPFRGKQNNNKNGQKEQNLSVHISFMSHIERKRYITKKWRGKSKKVIKLQKQNGQKAIVAN